MRSYFRTVFALIVVLLHAAPSFAWTRSVELGAGFSPDPNASQYNNYGLLLSGELFPLHRTPWTFWSINGSIGQWRTNAPENKNLTTGALALSLRFYPFDVRPGYPAYLFGSVGPAYISSKEFGVNSQAENFTIQTVLGLGVEAHQYDFNLRAVHYSNADLALPNDGYNILFVFSIGYLFC